MKAAESEFGMPFWDIVRGFAQDGCASGTTARILGFSGQDQFRRLQKAYGMEIDWPAHGQDLANKSPRGEYTEERTAKRLATMAKNKALQSRAISRKSAA